MNRIKLLDNLIQLIFYTILITSGINGLIYFLTRGLLNLPKSVALYKELLYSIFIFLGIIKYFITLAHAQSPKRQASTIMSGSFLLLMVLTFILVLVNDFKPIILFQIKLDILPLLFFISSSLYLSTLNKKKFDTFISRCIKIIIDLAIINAIFAILEVTILQNNILSFVLKNLGHFGDLFGIKIITVQGNRLRAFGLLNGFVHLGDFLLISIAILLFLSKNLKNYFKILIASILFLGILSSIYKSAYVGSMFLIFFLLILNHANPKWLAPAIVLTLIPFFTIIGYLTSLTIYPYQLISPISAYIAEHSLLARYNTFLRLTQQPGNILTGYGLGKNGTYLPQQSHLALDSLFIYIVSNYGMIVFILIQILAFIALLVILHRIYSNRGDEFDGLAFFLITYFVFLEAWFNNVLGTYPISYIFFFFLSVFVERSKKLAQA